MSIFQAIILGIVQGLTEFIPVSSSGHLVLVPHLFNFPPQPLVFDTTLHLGTALAAIIYFWKDLVGIVKNRDMKMISYLVLGSLPVFVVGFLFADMFDSKFGTTFWVSITLLAGACFMLLGDFVNKKLTSYKEIDNKKSFLIGLFQVFALFPGFSRSGASIAGGMLLGLDKVSATKFSFLLSVPVILGAGIFKLLSDSSLILSGGLGLPLLFGFFVSFVSGWLAIRFMMMFLEKKGLITFVIYRGVLALIIILTFFN